MSIVDSFNKKTTREILQDNQTRSKVKGMCRINVLLHNIRSMHNVGSVFRSADATGIGEIILSGYTPTPPRSEITKTALGAEEFVNWSFKDSVTDYLKTEKSKGTKIIGIEQTHESTSILEFNPNPINEYLLIFGNEVKGIDDEIMPFIDQCIEIPQFGEKHSFNISVTVGIVFYHFMKSYH